MDNNSSNKFNNKKGIEDELAPYLEIILEQLQSLNKSLSEIGLDLDEENELDEISQDMEEEVVLQSIEEQFGSWLSTFYSTISYLMIMNILFLASIVDPRWKTLPLIFLGFFPVYLYIAFLWSIPEIVVDGEVVFSWKHLSIRRQFRLGKTLFKYFSEELFRHSPLGVFLLGLSIIFLGLVAIQTYFI